MGPAKKYNENVFQPPWECEHRQRSWALPKSTMKMYFSLLGNVNTGSDHGPCQKVQWKCISASLGMWTQTAIMGPAKMYNENVFQPPWECEHRQRSWALPKSTMKMYFSLLGNVNTGSDHGPCQKVQWKCISASLGMWTQAAIMGPARK